MLNCFHKIWFLAAKCLAGHWIIWIATIYKIVILKVNCNCLFLVYVTTFHKDRHIVILCLVFCFGGLMIAIFHIWVWVLENTRHPRCNSDGKFSHEGKNCWRTHESGQMFSLVDDLYVFDLNNWSHLHHRVADYCCSCLIESMFYVAFPYI